jgi:iron complex outermembrane receptor protein
MIALAALADERPITIRVEVKAGDSAVPGARVSAGGSPVETDPQGRASLEVPAGPVKLTVTKEGFLPSNVTITVTEPRDVLVELAEAHEVEEEVTVYATRTGQRLQDEPVRVEVLMREEIEEKMLMTPGDIVMMLNEMGGLRVQTTSPSLGAASVRIQGMRGRYTRFLSDGLPVFGQQGGGLGLLQIPPTDLGQVEVIKGVSSALYGAGAMGGVVNLVSRRPTDEPVREFLINRSTLGATDATAFLGGKLNQQWSSTFLGGGHWQERRDIDDDNWTDLAHYSRAIARPRLFWNGGEGRSGFLTGGITYENRDGGTMPGRVLRATGAPYVESLNTRRYDAGGSLQLLIANRFTLTSRAAASWQNHDHQFGDVRERDRHEMLFGEVAIRGAAGRNTWVAGVAVERDAYRPRDVSRFGYAFTTPGVFFVDDIAIAPWFLVSASARADFHNEYGAFLSPRISALLRSGGWTSRVSFGQGFFAPTPLTEETEAAGLSRLRIPSQLVAERGRSGSWDITRTLGHVSLSATVFASSVRHPVHVERSTVYQLTNLPDPATNRGLELLGVWRKAPFSVTASYTYVRSREQGEEIPLTPRHSLGLVGMWEIEDKWRVGVECYYTGKQRLEENPFRSQSKPYVIAGFLIERAFGPVRLFLNAENLTNVRQTRWDSLIRPTRSVDGRWTVDAWAPLDGRVLNGGIRFHF